MIVYCECVDVIFITMRWIVCLSQYGWTPLITAAACDRRPVWNQNGSMYDHFSLTPNKPTTVKGATTTTLFSIPPHYFSIPQPMHVCMCIYFCIARQIIQDLFSQYAYVHDYVRVGHAQECWDVTLKNASNCACMTVHLYTCHIMELEEGGVSESEEDSANEGREDGANAIGPSGLGGELNVNVVCHGRREA